MENFNNKKPPRTWLTESILVTIFCCMPLGIVGIINAARVEKMFYLGDIDGANKASAEAKRWTSASFFIGIALVIIYVIFVFIGVAFEN